MGATCVELKGLYMIKINNNIDIRKSTKLESQAIARHNERLHTYYTNENINKELSHLNTYKQFNEERTNERVNGVQTFNCVFTISFDRNNNKEFKEADKFANHYIKELKNNFFPNNDLISKNWHLDETTPHIHFSFSAYDNELNKFNARQQMNRTLLRDIKTWEKEFINGTIEKQPKIYELKESILTKDQRQELSKEHNLDINQFSRELIEKKLNTKDLREKYNKAKELERSKGNQLERQEEDRTNKHEIKELQRERDRNQLVKR